MTIKPYTIAFFTSSLFIWAFLFQSSNLYSQISVEAEPPSFSYQIPGNPPAFFNRSEPSVEKIQEEDEVLNGSNPQIGKVLPLEIDVIKQGNWKTFPDGKICQTEIYIPNAKALGLIFDKLSLPKGGQLFIYNPEKTQVLGAYTSQNNIKNNYFSVELLIGDRAIIEYFEPRGSSKNALIHLKQVSYIYEEIPDFLKRSAAPNDISGSCNVNVNCPEGEPWKIQKDGVVKILLTDGGRNFWCSGSLINNTNNDGHPYLLTANHCGEGTSQSEYSQWLFYFLNESPTCTTTNPTDNKTLTGSELIAHSGRLEAGFSDFKLLELNNGEEIPIDYAPFFNGWDRTGESSLSGVCIHHPSGDIKKISFYTNPIVSSKYDNVAPPDPNGLFWRVNWSATKNGHGVTEGGSSGSPIFSQNGYILGTLSGGLASCVSKTLSDWFGKFSSHWTSNGSSPDRQLEPWLDPTHSGAMILAGKGSKAAANFNVNSKQITLGDEVAYKNTSSGTDKITHYKWTFDGGIPNSYESDNFENPPLIQYNQYGNYETTLEVSIVDDQGERTASLTKGIIVVPNFYRNSDGSYILAFGKNVPENIQIRLFSADARASDLNYIQSGTSSIKISPLTGPQGVYILQIKGNNFNMSKKIFK